MNEPAGGPPQHADGDDTDDSSTPSFADSLELLKQRHPAADTTPVNDATGGRPRLNWSPVTDGGVDPGVESSVKAGFRFDLGGALAKIGGDPTESDQAPARPDRLIDAGTVSIASESVVETSPHPEFDVGTLLARFGVDDPVRRGAGTVPTIDSPPPHEATASAQPTVADALPRRGAAPVDSAASFDAAPVPPVAARRSVFEDPGTVQPTLPTTLPTTLQPTLQATFPTTQTAPSAVTEARVTPALAPTTAAVSGVGPAPTLPDGPRLPSLPAAAPIQHPAYTPPIENAPSTPDLHALRSAQLRASRQQQRGGKLFGRALLAIVVLGGLIAAALVFGRPLLFPVEWDAALTPIVDDIQLTNGVDFDHTVELVRQPSADYALTIAPLIAGADWVSSVPEWRALGLATGDPSPSSLATSLAAGRLAVYDPDADRIYLNADADPAAAQIDLRLAAEAAYAAQRADLPALDDVPVSGLTGTASLRSIAEAAVARYLAERSATVTAAAPPADPSLPATPPATSTGLPLPIEYQLVAIDTLGEALLRASGFDPATYTAAAGVPSGLDALLDDAPRQAPTSILLVGEQALADPVALGVDDWSLVWGARLPGATTSQLTRIVTADSYRQIDRAGLTCVVGVFETATAIDAGIVLSAMTAWATGAPPASQAVASSTSERTVQLVTCDPGASAATPPPVGVVNDLIERQLRRLGS